MWEEKKKRKQGRNKEIGEGRGSINTQFLYSLLHIHM